MAWDMLIKMTGIVRGPNLWIVGSGRFYELPSEENDPDFLERKDYGYFKIVQ